MTQEEQAALMTMDTATYSRWLISSQIAMMRSAGSRASMRGASATRPDAPRVVTQAHASQRQQLEQCVRETMDFYGCSAGMALRRIEFEVAAFEGGAYTKALAARGVTVASDAGDTNGEPPKPWSLALAKRDAR